MWMEKIRCAVLAVQTDIGVRYVRLPLSARVRLAWTFRHFAALPEEVLSGGERALIASLLAGGNFVPGTAVDSCIGTIEKKTPLPPRKPADSVGASEVVSPARASG
jgi:hypothetical protein